MERWLPNRFIFFICDHSDNLAKDLCKAAKKGCVEGVRAALDAGADVNRRGHQYSHSPLMLAANSGHDKCLELLIKAGADIECEEAWTSRTSLMVAAVQGHDNCLELLIHAGADLNKKDRFGCTALILATERKGKTDE